MAEEMELMMQLAELGFPPERIQRALKATECKGLDVALDYLQNEFDPPQQQSMAVDDEDSKEPLSAALKASQDSAKAAEEPSSSSTAAAASSSVDKKIESVDDLQQKLAEKRKLNSMKEEHAMKEQELKRRQEGKDVLAIKRQRDALERQKLIEERKKQSEDERKRKERVLALIAEDRETQNQMVNAMPEEAPKPSSPAAAESMRMNGTSDNLRVMIRGTALGKPLKLNLSSDCTLDDVIGHIEEEHPNVMLNHRLIVALPHREFERREYTKSLQDLGLFPSVVLTLAPKGGVL